MRGKEWDRNELMQAPEQVGTKEYGKMLKTDPGPGGWQGPDQGFRDWKSEGQKRRITRKEYQRLLNKLEMEGFMAQKGICGISLRKRCCRIEESGLRKKVNL